MKKCSSCKSDLDESMFCKDARSKDGLAYSCRSCRKIAQGKIPTERKRQQQSEWQKKNRDLLNKRQREKYKENPEKRKSIAAAYRAANTDAVRERSRKYKAESREMVSEYKASRGCESCGVKDPRVLDLHHSKREDKIMAVSQLISKASKESVMNEMLKCRVLCANCHRIEHAEEIGVFFRAS